MEVNALNLVNESVADKVQSVPPKLPHLNLPNNVKAAPEIDISAPIADR